MIFDILRHNFRSYSISNHSPISIWVHMKLTIIPHNILIINLYPMWKFPSKESNLILSEIRKFLKLMDLKYNSDYVILQPNLIFFLISINSNKFWKNQTEIELSIVLVESFNGVMDWYVFCSSRQFKQICFDSTNTLFLTVCGATFSSIRKFRL